MTFEETIGFLVAIAITGVAAILVSTTRWPAALKRLIYVALGLRVAGAFLRYTVLLRVYRGQGDARGYFGRGLEYAERFWSFDFSPFYDPTLWFRGRWTGTSFMSFPSGIVLSLIGPSMLGEFVVFSLLSFIGLCGFAVAFRRSNPDIPLQRYARWIWLFPSLWFWPSSVGKEAIVLMGIGLAVAGFIGRRGRVSWPLTITGTFLVFAIRPQVAAVVLFSMVLAYWLSFGRRWTPAKTLQGATILAAGLVGLWLAMDRIGVEGFDIEGVQDYMEAEASRAAPGDSSVGQVNVGLSGIPMALVNILTRPWPWEAGNAMALLSAVEMLMFWGIVWHRRKNFTHALRNWRSHALLRLAVPFIFIYSVSLGMLVVNLGIIARQRVFLFPFLFLLLEAAPAPARRRRLRRPFQSPPPAQPTSVGMPEYAGEVK